MVFATFWHGPFHFAGYFTTFGHVRLQFCMVFGIWYSCWSLEGSFVFHPGCHLRCHLGFVYGFICGFIRGFIDGFIYGSFTFHLRFHLEFLSGFMQGFLSRSLIGLSNVQMDFIQGFSLDFIQGFIWCFFRVSFRVSIGGSIWGFI